MNNFPLFALTVIMLLCLIGCADFPKRPGFNHETAYESMVRLNQNPPQQWAEWDKKYPNSGKVVIEHYDENGRLIGKSVEK